MLLTLRIRNLALIEDLTWELGPGFNILTGETGAGKSILIDAFNLLLGERADRTLIRDGAQECAVEGLLEVSRPVAAKIGALGLDGVEVGEGELLLKRTFSLQGQNRQSVNGSPVTLQMLKQLGDLLVDLHGPHDHQSLLSKDQQIRALDAAGPYADELSKVQEAWAVVQALKGEIEALEAAAQGDVKRRLDFLQHQISEIEQVDPKPGEDEQIEQEYRVATHAQRIVELASGASALLAEGEGNVLEVLARVQRSLQEWEGLDPAAESVVAQNSAVVGQVQELLRDIETRVRSVDLDPSRLGELEARLNLLQGLKRKYGGGVAAILAQRDQMVVERDQLAHLEENRAGLNKRLEAASTALRAASQALTQSRAAHAPKLAQSVARQLKSLGFKQASFEIHLEPRSEPNSRGLDEVDFVFAPNPGESPRPLRSIASSGEMARVMLALKSVLAEQDGIPILIFDEIDANVGGETALAVGERLRKLADCHQVLCITHLPQVAAAGHRHFRVEKKTAKGRTTTQLEDLDAGGRKEELGRMLGGANASALKLAAELLGHFGK
ncbi:MAG: DNA repair protein RecN [Candidatus Methylacidiphilales bacterium]|nr:DNA repair protein RecN [Candidatus Methylacidiphilales bacterium]